MRRATLRPLVSYVLTYPRELPLSSANGRPLAENAPPHASVCSEDPQPPTMCTAAEEGSTKVFLAYHLQGRLLTLNGMKMTSQPYQEECQGLVAVEADIFKTMKERIGIIITLTH